MNPIVQAFLEERKKRHLISLGLIDETKTKHERKYYNHSVPGAKFDNARNQYFLEGTTYFPIAVTDEEYQEIQKYAPISDNKTKNINNTHKKRIWSDIIKNIAWIYLIGGILINVFGWILFDYKYKYDGLFYMLLEYSGTIIHYCVSFIFIMGISKVVAAAEKYLSE